MPNYRAIAERYLATWNEPDAGRRRRLVEAGWTEDARYADPLMEGQGHDGITAMIEGARARFPGHGFTLRGEPDGHGPHLRFSWSLAPIGGTVVAGGTDVARVADDGRLAEVTGFLDRSETHD